MVRIIVCGVDEAGRGPVLGPLVMCGILIKEEDESKLKNLGVKDSKLLTKEKREELFDKIIKIAQNYKIIISEPKEIDDAVNGKNSLNLNKLEAVKTAEILNFLKPVRAIVDAPSNNISNYKRYLKDMLDNKRIDLLVEHKADLNHVVVAAASVLAKVTRDNEIEKLKKKLKVDFGSGYMSDSKTVEFLEKNYKNQADLFRKSWIPYKKIVDKQFQSNLGDFSKFVDDIEKKDKTMEDNLKKLEDLGYVFVPTSTEHEKIRMKGLCTITLYKSGKLLIQGKEKDKKVVEKILK